MNSRLVITTLCALVVLRPAVPAAGEGESTRRATRHSVRPIEMHDVHIGATLPEVGDERPLRTRGQPDRPRSVDSPPFHSVRQNTYMMHQPPPTAEERPRRNWLLPAFSDDEVSEEEREPSGWGWLADAVMHRRLDEETGQREEMEREENELWELQFQMEGEDSSLRGLVLNPRMFMEAASPHEEDADTVSEILEDAIMNDPTLLDRMATMEIEPVPGGVLGNRDPAADVTEDEETYGDRWGMIDRIWGRSEDESAVNVEPEAAAVQSLLPSVREQIRPADLAPAYEVDRERVDVFGSAPPATTIPDMDANQDFTESEAAFGSFDSGLTDMLQDTWGEQTVGFGREESSFQPLAPQRPTSDFQQDRPFQEW